LDELGKIQCVSTFTCEWAFSIQIFVKIRVKNKFASKNLKAIIRIALKEANENFDNIIHNASPLWENGIQLRYLYSNPKRYLTSNSNDSCNELLGKTSRTKI